MGVIEFPPRVHWQMLEKDLGQHLHRWQEQGPLPAIPTREPIPSEDGKLSGERNALTSRAPRALYGKLAGRFPRFFLRAGEKRIHDSRECVRNGLFPLAFGR